MSKPITGKTTTSTWKQKRKNGDIYVWERQTVYIPEPLTERTLLPSWTKVVLEKPLPLIVMDEESFNRNSVRLLLLSVPPRVRLPISS